MAGKWILRLSGENFKENGIMRERIVSAGSLELARALSRAAWIFYAGRFVTASRLDDFVVDAWFFHWVTKESDSHVPSDNARITCFRACKIYVAAKNRVKDVPAWKEPWTALISSTKNKVLSPLSDQEATRS